MRFFSAVLSSDATAKGLKLSSGVSQKSRHGSGIFCAAALLFFLSSVCLGAPCEIVRLTPLPSGWMIPWWSTQRLSVKSNPEKRELLFTVLQNRGALSFDFCCSNMPQEPDLSAIHDPSRFLAFDSDLEMPVQLILKDGNTTAKITCRKPVQIKKGCYHYEFPLAGTENKIRQLSVFSLFFPKKFKTQQFKIWDFAIYSRQNRTKIPPAKLPDELKKYIEQLKMVKVREEDNLHRPEIRNGAWFMDGNYTFFTAANVSFPKDSLQHQNCCMHDKHIAYRKFADKEVLDALGYNSSHFAVPTFFFTWPQNYGISRNWKNRRDTAETFLKKQGDVPLIVDFADVQKYEFNYAFPERIGEMEQKNPNWHHFIPFCPDSPDGWQFYETCFRLGISSLLKTGANPFVYELFNESRYNCFCECNKRQFACEMLKKYGSLQAANRKWHTQWKNTEELVKAKNYLVYPRMIPDWHDFASDRYVEILKKGKAVIRSVDHRRNIYVAEQISQTCLLDTPAAIGMDYRKIAKVVDSLASEGGWRSYGYGKIKYGGIMEDAATGGNCYSYLADVFQALSKGKKPIINHEHYCGRFINGKRVPSLPSDIITSMWNEIMHGASGSYHYLLGGWLTEWKDLAGARKQVEKPSWKSYMMLNPYAYPLETLQAFETFNKELEPYRDQVLPMPRTGKPSVAIYFSYPTLIMSYSSKEKVRKKVLEWYNAVLFRQYPLQIVFDEDLQTLDDSVKVLVAPSATYIHPHSLENIRQFIRRGGTVVADLTAFTRDEYGDPLPQFTDKSLFRFDAGQESSCSSLRNVLQEKKVPRYGVVQALDGPELEQTELHLIDRGNFKLCFVVNMEYGKARKVRIRLNLKDKGGFFLKDIVRKKTLVRKNSRTWTAEDLQNGFPCTIPPQERVLFVLERIPSENMPELTLE